MRRRFLFSSRCSHTRAVSPSTNYSYSRVMITARSLTVRYRVITFIKSAVDYSKVVPLMGIESRSVPTMNHRYPRHFHHPRSIYFIDKWSYTVDSSSAGCCNSSVCSYRTAIQILGGRKLHIQIRSNDFNRRTRWCDYLRNEPTRVIVISHCRFIIASRSLIEINYSRSHTF